MGGCVAPAARTVQVREDIELGARGGRTDRRVLGVRAAAPPALPRYATARHDWEPLEVIWREPGLEWRLNESMCMPRAPDGTHWLFVHEHAARASVVAAANAMTKARVLADLFSHENLLKPGANRWIRLFGTSASDESAVLVFEHAAGGPLSLHVDKRGRLIAPAASRSEVVRMLVVQLLEGLAWLHDCGYAWSGISTDQMFLDGTGALKLRPVGIARIGDPVAHAQALQWTRPRLLPPEATRSGRAGDPCAWHAASSRADIFAVGVLAAEWATGIHPFGSPVVASSGRQTMGEAAAVVSPEPAVRPFDAGWTPPCVRRPLASPVWTAFVNAAAAVAKSARFSSATEALRHPALRGPSEPQPFVVATKHRLDTSPYPPQVRNLQSLVRPRAKSSRPEDLPRSKNDAKGLDQVLRALSSRVLKSGDCRITPDALKALTHKLDAQPRPKHRSADPSSPPFSTAALEAMPAAHRRVVDSAFKGWEARNVQPCLRAFTE